MTRTKPQNLFKLQWCRTLGDYVTAIAWSPDGTWFAASSAAGDVVKYETQTGETTVLQEGQGESVDALSISADGGFIAAGGQAGKVWIWTLDANPPTLITTLEHSRTWIDCLQWNPRYPERAFSLGRYVQVWDVTTEAIVTTLNFESSSVLALTWHPQGDRLSAGGNQSVKTWQRQDWGVAPTVREVGGASVAIAWSPDGTFLASGNNDCSVIVWEDGKPYPWRMRGFPGKVRQLAWSMAKNADAPLLASISGQSVVVWTKDRDPVVGWNPEVLDAHQGVVRAIAFQLESLFLASAAEDGCLYFWNKGSRLVQMLNGAAGFSRLAWDRSGGVIAAGDSHGNVLVWTKNRLGKGFG